MTSISQSSIAALLIGLGVLAALRWDAAGDGRRRRRAGAGRRRLRARRRELDPRRSEQLEGSRPGDDGALSTSSRAESTCSTSRPLTGYGAGSFAVEYRSQQRAPRPTAPSRRRTRSRSRSPPSRECSAWRCTSSCSPLASAGCSGRTCADRRRGSRSRRRFTALVLHTMAYADFLEDPITWTLLGIGAALAAARPVREPRAAEQAGDAGGRRIARGLTRARIPQAPGDDGRRLSGGRPRRRRRSRSSRCRSTRGTSRNRSTATPRRC